MISTLSEVQEISVQTLKYYSLHCCFCYFKKEFAVVVFFFFLQVKLQERSRSFGNDIRDLNISMGTIGTHIADRAKPYYVRQPKSYSS